MAHSSTDNQTPWKNGHYHMGGSPSEVWLVEGESLMTFGASGKPTNMDNPMYKGTLKYGDFGDTTPDIEKESGKSRYNVEIIAWGGVFKPLAVLSDDRRKMTFTGIDGSVDFLEWMSPEEFEVFLNSGDPADSPPSNYKIQPENQGKLLWISGAPGLGKSTSGLLLSKKAGYVYYEADAFMGHMNPYVPTDVKEPSIAMCAQKFLKGVPQHRLDTVASGMPEFMGLLDGKEYDFEKLCKLYSLMSEDIAKEQRRIGGDWAVAHAVPTRKFRDHIRKQLGTNLIFIVLHMTKEDQIARIKGRHGNEETFVNMLTKSYDIFEPADEDEPNCIPLVITKDMTRDDVVDKIIRLVKDY